MFQAEDDEIRAALESLQQECAQLKLKTAEQDSFVKELKERLAAKNESKNS